MPLASHRRYRFGRCELRTSTRELRVDGSPRPMEPLAYDLLVYLLRHRAQPLSKDRLLDEVWLGREVSVGALARAVMLVRKAIDDADAAQLRTLHGVGYQLVVDVHEETEATALPQARDDAPVPLALLPFENLTGDLSLDWTRVGLMGLVGGVLAGDTRLAPLTAEVVLATLRAVGPDAPLPTRVEALRARSPACQVVHTRIRHEAGGYRLDYRLLPGPDDGWAALHAADPMRLARALARRLVHRLLPGSPPGDDAFPVHDPWAMQLHARAMQAIHDGDLASARLMLNVVLDLEPDYAEARRASDRLAATGPAP